VSSAQPNFVNLATILAEEQIALDEQFWQKACELRVCVPAIVVSFDTSSQLVTVQPSVQENVMMNLVPTPVNLPQLSMLQVGMFRGGGFSITLPLQAGDEGWVIFADLCINAWKKSGGIANNQEERRRHDLSDGWFLPMGWSQPRNLPDYSNDSLQIRSDDGMVSINVNNTEIEITPDDGTTSISIVAGAITLTGLVTINGGLTVTGDSTIDGIVFATHTHSGVTTGSGDTGPPV
jgi:hypothetical protein